MLIATAVYSADSPEVQLLRHFRDTHSKLNLLGRQFVKYIIEPVPPDGTVDSKIAIAGADFPVFADRGILDSQKKK
ncbi:MAG: hypothetical protein R3C26_25665 [Calditrichia bacterium]